MAEVGREMGMDVEIITLDSFPYIRRVLWGSLIRTVLRYVGIFLVGVVAMPLFGYLIYGMRAQLANLFLAGLLVGSPTLYVASKWALHFSLQLRQLARLEAKVRAGESIPASEVRFHVYGMRKPAGSPR